MFILDELYNISGERLAFTCRETAPSDCIVLP
jgi:hypothetical protein